jgi:hypothetical protein
MWILLTIVASAASVLSFSALRELAELCGFSTSLAWLLPVVVDAGAAAGCLVWLTSSSSRGEEELACRSSRGEDLHGQRFARSLTFVLLASSVAGNALVHGLTAYHLQPAWWVVVTVSAVAPAVLGAVVHLAVLVGRPGAVGGTDAGPDGFDTVETAGAHVASGAHVNLGRRRLAAELGVTEHQARRLLAEKNGAGS